MSCTVVDLWRYPVKSMAGERLSRADLDVRIAGDREWGVFDAETGRLLSAKSVDTLLLARARYLGGETAIELPDGTTVTAGTAEATRAISAWLARPIVLRRAGAGETARIDMELDDGSGDGPSGVESFMTAPGYLYDSKSTLHVVSAATLASFERDHAAGAGDVRRFRPNVVVDGIAAFAEDAWVDGDLQVGGVRAHCRKRTERCVIVSRAQPGVEIDRGLLRHLKARHQMRVGVYLDPRSAGPIAIGDPVAPVAAA